MTYAATLTPRHFMGTRKAPVALGRKPKTEEERADKRFSFYANAAEERELDAAIPKGKQSTEFKKVVFDFLRGELIPKVEAESRTMLALSQIGANDMTLPHLGTIICGPVKEAVADAEEFTISKETAGFLKADDDDFWFDAEGQSLEGACIFDGYRLLMRPLGEYGRAKVGQIVLVESSREDEEPTYTLKRLSRSTPFEVESVQLDPATGAEIAEIYPLPEKANNKAKAVMIGLMASFI